jgi:hypothetical protein
MGPVKKIKSILIAKTFKVSIKNKKLPICQPT